MPARLLIVGASARAAAQSAHRAGIAVSAVDLFADQDLCEIADVISCPAHDYPQALPALAARLPASPFCYVGGLENHPEVVAELQATRPLLGVPPATLRRCRDPFQLLELAQREGLSIPETRYDPPDPADDASWLRKPFASSGGLGMQLCCSADSIASQAGQAIGVSSRHYFQRYQPGTVCAGSFWADANGCRLLGVSHQLTAGARCGAAAQFAYAGSVGPLVLDPADAQAWDTLGRCVAHHFQLEGLFGIDAICANAPGAAPMMLEVNPRYTASMELWDLVSSPLGQPEWLPLMGAWLGATRSEASGRPRAAGKFILYAQRSQSITPQWLARLRNYLRAGEWLADIPRVPLGVAAGRPITTVIVTGRSYQSVLARVHTLARETESLTGGAAERPSSGSRG
ncbi:MAG: ATP-grasp domain-containing protein [Planctomycetota bacterium]